MIVRRSLAGRLCASAVVVLAFGSTQSLAQSGEYYVVGQGAGRISVLQGGGINRQWNTVNGTNESPIHVSDFVYTTSFNVGVTGGIYQLDGTDTGGRPVHPGSVGSFFDAASDATNSFIVDFSTKDVYSADLDYANPVRLFNAGGNVNPLGITWDDSNNSLWIADWGGTLIANYDMAGNLLSSFTSATNLNVGLAMDYADGTLWVGDRNIGGRYYQYDRNGNLLNTLDFGAIAGDNLLGGEFRAIPAPGTLALMGLGGLAFARRRRR